MTVPLANPIRYLSLPITIFLGMWLVLSYARRNEPHTSTLAILTTPAGYHNYITPPVVLIFQQELKLVKFLFARERQETTQLLPFLISRATSR